MTNNLKQEILAAMLVRSMPQNSHWCNSLDGFTVDANLEIPNDGYMVGTGEGETWFEDLTTEQALAYVRSIWPLLENPCNYLGAWQYENKLCVEISENINCLPDAAKVGKERQQIAVWDLANHLEIVL